MATESERSSNVLCVDNELALNDALSELKQYNKTSDNILSVDGESRKGQLRIISVATREKAYTFDVLTIGKDIFKGGLREILEDSTQEKCEFRNKSRNWG